MAQKIGVKTITPEKKQNSRSGLVVNLAYVCAALAVVLVTAQFWLYGIRYQRVFAKDTWSAVTLLNGQTYFGKLQQYGPHTVVLFEVYYLQNSTATESTSAEAAVTEPSETAEAEATTDSGLQLFSLQSDFHKPNNYLIINRDQILFWQHLSADSPIVQTIAGEN